MGISGKALTMVEIARVIELRRLGWSVRAVVRETGFSHRTVATLGACSLIARPDALAVVIAAREKAKTALAVKRAALRRSKGPR